MKIRWLYNSKLASRIKVNAIVLYPFVFVRASSATSKLMAHELAHIAQIRREGILTFYSKYLWYYFKNLRRYRNSHQAYLNIPYEIEAREAEKPLTRQ